MSVFFFFNDTATTEIYTLSLHDALPICDPDKSKDFINRPFYVGEAFLHADKSASDKSDDITQPRMTGVQSVEIFWLKFEASSHSASELQNLYEVLQYGFGGPLFNFEYQTDNVYENTLDRKSVV